MELLCIRYEHCQKNEHDGISLVWERNLGGGRSHHPRGATAQPRGATFADGPRTSGVCGGPPAEVAHIYRVVAPSEVCGPSVEVAHPT